MSSVTRCVELQEDVLKMRLTNGPYIPEQSATENHSSPCEQAAKPDKIIRLPIQYRNRQTHTTRTVDPESVLLNNVISIATVVKSAEQLNGKKTMKANFRYPQMECS